MHRRLRDILFVAFDLHKEIKKKPKRNSSVKHKPSIHYSNTTLGSSKRQSPGPWASA
jgi:hypothetical protein